MSIHESRPRLPVLLLFTTVMGCRRVSGHLEVIHLYLGAIDIELGVLEVAGRVRSDPCCNLASAKVPLDESSKVGYRATGGVCSIFSAIYKFGLEATRVVVAFGSDLVVSRADVNFINARSSTL